MKGRGVSFEKPKHTNSSPQAQRFCPSCDWSSLMFPCSELQPRTAPGCLRHRHWGPSALGQPQQTGTGAARTHIPRETNPAQREHFQPQPATLQCSRAFKTPTPDRIISPAQLGAQQQNAPEQPHKEGFTQRRHQITTHKAQTTIELIGA